MSSSELCPCGKLAEHVNAAEDSTEWACLVPNFDRYTGKRLPQVTPSPAPQPADGEREVGECEHPDEWFDRSVCPPPCDSMHHRCTECGEALDGCPLDDGAIAVVHMDLGAPQSTRRALDALVVAARRDAASPASAEPTDDDRAKAIVAMSQALDSDRLTIGHAIALVAQLLASQRAEIVARYEKVADDLAALPPPDGYDGDPWDNGWDSALNVAEQRIREAAPK